MTVAMSPSQHHFCNNTLEFGQSRSHGFGFEREIVAMSRDLLQARILLAIGFVLAVIGTFLYLETTIAKSLVLVPLIAAMVASAGAFFVESKAKIS